MIQGDHLHVFNLKPEKYARQIGSFPQVRLKIKDVWNHHRAAKTYTKQPEVFHGYLKGWLNLQTPTSL